jgi:hypothetical protein
MEEPGMQLRWLPAQALSAMRRGIPVSLVLALGVVPPAWAQSATMITAPQDIAACLCLEQAVSVLARDMEARKAIYEEKGRLLEGLDGEVAASRRRLNVENPNEVAAFRDLLDRRNAAQAELADRAAPDYAALVAA